MYEIDYTKQIDQKELKNFALLIIQHASDKLPNDIIDGYINSIKDSIYTELINNTLALTSKYEPLSIEEYIDKIKSLYELFKNFVSYFSPDEIKLVKQNIFIPALEDLSAVSQFSFLSSYQDLYSDIKK